MVQLIFTQCPTLTANQINLFTINDRKMAELLLEHGANPHHCVDTLRRLAIKFGRYRQTLRDIANDPYHRAFSPQSGFELEYAAATGNRVGVEAALAKKPSALVITEALAYAVGQARAEIIPMLLAAGAETGPALTVLQGILLQNDAANKDLYKEIHALLISQEKKEVPSLKELILTHKNSEIRKRLTASIWDQPGELRNRVVPLLDDQLQLFVQHHGVKALSHAIAEKKSELIVPLIKYFRSWFSELVKKYAAKPETFDTVLDTLDIKQGDHSTLQALLVFALETKDAELIRLLLTHPRLGALFIKALVDVVHDPLRTPLHLACMRGDAEEVRQQLENLPALTRDSSGFSLLMHAAGNGHPTAARLLIEKQPLGRLSHNGKGVSPLMLAAELGDKEMVQLLLKNPSGWPHSDDEIVLFTLIHLTCTTREGLSALDYAVLKGDAEIVEFLVKSLNAALIPKNHEEEPSECKHARIRDKALAHACEKGDLDCVKVLLKHGANPRNFNAVALAAKGRNKNIVTLLLSDPSARGIQIELANSSHAGFTALMHACIHGDEFTARLLLEAGANPFLYSNYQPAALHHAVTHRHYQLMRLLLANTKDSAAAAKLANQKAECTPLSIAIKKIDTEAVKILLEQGATVTAEDLIQASCSYNKPLMELLIPHAQQEVLNIALRHECRHGNNSEYLGMLIEHGADTMAKIEYTLSWGYYGPEVPLISAADQEHDTEKVLLKQLLTHPRLKALGKQMFEQRNTFERTAIEHACYYGYETSVRVLLDYGDYDELPHVLISAFGIALEYHPHILTLFLSHWRLNSTLKEQMLNKTNALKTALKKNNEQLLLIFLHHNATVLPEHLGLAVCLTNCSFARLLLERINKNGALSHFLTVPLGHAALGHFGFASVPALFHAAFHGGLETVKLLVALGANPHQKIDGRTPLDYAKAARQYEIVKYLHSLKNPSIFAPLGALWSANKK